MPTERHRGHELTPEALKAVPVMEALSHHIFPKDAAEAYMEEFMPAFTQASLESVWIALAKGDEAARRYGVGMSMAEERTQIPTRDIRFGNISPTYALIYGSLSNAYHATEFAALVERGKGFSKFGTVKGMYSTGPGYAENEAGILPMDQLVTTLQTEGILRREQGIDDIVLRLPF